MSAPDFWAKVDRRGSAQCWRWRGSVRDDGYGRHFSGGAQLVAHRVALAASGVEVRPEDVVRHLCNNRLCCNPRHLRTGTHADNQRDKVVAGRQAKGRKNGRAKLTEEVVRILVRRMKGGERKTDLALEFGVTRRALRFIETGKNWAHVHAAPVQASLGVAQ